MPSERPDSNPPRRNPAKRDPRLDAKPPTSRPGRPGPVVPPLQAANHAGLASDESGRPGWKELLKKPPVIWGAAGTGLLLVVIVVAIALSRGKGDVPPEQATSAEGQSATQTGNASIAVAPDELIEPRHPVKCRINTPEPGFVAFIDEQPVRDAKGKLLATPCEVTLDEGRHTIRVAKKGWNDIPRVEDISGEMTFNQEPTYEPFAEQGTTFSAPYLNAEVGKPVLLKPLEFNGRCQDPFVSASGRDIWFAGTGPDGMGIYTSSRRTAWDEWETPSLLLLSRGADLPASPSATEDALLVAYTMPGKAGRVWGLTRKTLEDAFDVKKPLYYLEHGEAEWPSAQLTPDGKRLYGTELKEDKVTSWIASRKQLDVEFDKGKKLSLPAGHPHLSADELRQYTFDGKELKRASRSKPTGNFSTPLAIAVLDLPEYVVHPQRRQFWVTEDEQWMYYALNPAASGKMYVVRLKHGPGRGVLVVGGAVQPEKVEVAKTDEMKDEKPTEKPEKSQPQEPVVDPRTLPTVYAAYRLALDQAIARRDLAAASKLVTDAQANADLQSDRELLAWDAAELAEVQKFWTAVETAVKAIQPGDAVRIGGTGFTFEKFADGALTLKAKTKTVERQLTELSPGDLLAFADKVIEKNDPAGQHAIGVFLHFEGKSQAQTAKARFDRSSDHGDQFREHLAARRLRIIEKELARQNLSVALRQIEELASLYPQSPSTATAEQHRKEIYSYVKLNPQGSRQWQRSDDAGYTALPEKMPGSLLMSADEYEAFDLSLEWRANTPTGQGGVYFRYPGRGKPLETAFQIHLANDAGVPPDKFCTGSLFNYYPPTENAAKTGWNTLTMQVRGEKVTAFINGKKILETLATDPAVPLRGYVALDGELGGISYRKILLVEAVK